MAVAGELIYKFIGDTSNLDKTTKSVNSGFKGMTKSMVGANIITKALSKSFSLIAQNTSSAISRIDTFNNFPKVLNNFGVATDEANASIKRIDKSVRGLPTTLDQAVAGVQDLFMVTKDLKEAEKMFKAINDSAMVFAKGSTEAVDRFVYAYKQSMAMGKVSAQDFMQMNSAIPGLMDKVAESMGMSIAELKTGLSEGSISMQQFNEALKKLDTEGGAGMKSLESVAKSSTSGIETSMKNARAAVGRGVTSIIESIDKGLEKAGLGGVSDVISTMGKTIENALKTASPYIEKFVESLGKIYDWINKNKIAIEIFVGTIGALYLGFKALSIINSIRTSMMAFKTAIIAVQTTALLCGGSISKLRAVLMLLNLTFLASPIFWIIAGLTALVVAFVVLWNKCEGFRNFWTNLWNKLKTNVKNFGTSIVNTLKSLPDKLRSIGKNIALGLWNGIKGMKNFVINKVKNMGKSIIKGLKGALGIHSPSTEFAMIGKFSVLGYTEALDKMQKDVQDQVKDTFGLNPNLTSSLNNHFSPNVMVNNNINVESDPLGQTVRKIKTFSGGAKNDYNYGMGV